MSDESKDAAQHDEVTTYDGKPYDPNRKYAIYTWLTRKDTEGKDEVYLAGVA